MKPTERIYAILGGGDWADASVDHVVLDKDVDLEKMAREWHDWYQRIYIPALRAGESLAYLDLADWLLENGGRETDVDELMCVEEPQ